MMALIVFILHIFVLKTDPHESLNGHANHRSELTTMLRPILRVTDGHNEQNEDDDVVPHLYPRFSLSFHIT